MKNTATCINLKQLLPQFSGLLLFISITTSTLVLDTFHPEYPEWKARTDISNKNIFTKNDSAVNFTARFIVSFGSICCGINQKKRDEFINFVHKYKNTPSYSAHNWGKEGEIDYCFLLLELTAEEQAVFIKKAQKLLGKDRTIRTYENIHCPR